VLHVLNVLRIELRRSRDLLLGHFALFAEHP
jgi:hypothetical protein